VRYFCGATDWFSMQLSAQLASALAGALLVLPMFFLGRELFDRQAGFWGALLFQCLPVSSRMLSDGLSEATFLLFMTTALFLAVRAFRSPSPVLFALCGLCGGLAYLTRPEGALIVGATSLALLGVQFRSAWRRSWGNLLVCEASLLLAALVVGGPYVAITGHFTNKPSSQWLLEKSVQGRTAPLPNQRLSLDKPPSPSARVVRGPVLASIWSAYAPPGLKHRHWWGLKAIGTEVIRGYQYLFAVPVLLGLWWFRDRLRRVPGTWVVVTLCVLHVLVLWRLAVVAGYVSDRHVLILVLSGIFTGAAALVKIGQGLADVGGRLRSWGKGESQQPPVASCWPSLLLLAAVAAFGLPEALKPLHANRAGHRAAGLWIAAHSIPADPVLDPFCWAYYYAGRVFLEGQEAPIPPGHKLAGFIVLEKGEHPRIPVLDEAWQRAAEGKIVYHWPENVPTDEAKVFVYRVGGAD
jgi:4-amino-4-deoxy-L-arabinose transferase-like glycosyltransferase